VSTGHRARRSLHDRLLRDEGGLLRDEGGLLRDEGGLLRDEGGLLVDRRQRTLHHRRLRDEGGLLMHGRHNRREQHPGPHWREDRVDRG
jgi:hypothetical protein